MSQNFFVSLSSEQTYLFAANIAKKAKPGEIYCLTGDLGSGKTVFAKGFGKALGVKDEIVSPTFTIVNVYESALIPFYHFDFYRVLSEIEDIGYEEYFYGNGICLIEWAELIKLFIPKEAIWINIKKDFTQPDNYRTIIWESEAFL